MAKLDWLENNDYGERQTRKEYLLAALFLWGLALVILLVPVRSSAQNIYYINAAEDTPSITGHVVQLEPTMQRRKGLTGVKGGSYRAKIDIEYNGTPYYVTNFALTSPAPCTNRLWIAVKYPFTSTRSAPKNPYSARAYPSCSTSYPASLPH